MNTSNSSKRTTRLKILSLLSLRKNWFIKVVKVVRILFLCILVGLPLYIFSVSVDLFGLFGGMPDLREIENPENDLSSELISADGVSLGRYFRYNRSQVTFDELSGDLVHTLLCSEDQRFYKHSGLDLRAFLRAVKGVVTFTPEQGGGSTITQQLAKNLYTLNREKGLDGPIANLGETVKRVVEKTKECIIAVELEKNFTKEEIIALYLNTSAFNNNAYGIKVAAETYFNKSTDKLNIQESALLVGMLQNPSLYNPRTYPSRALKKRNDVVRELYKLQYIKTKVEYDSIKALPIALDFHVQNQNQGLATYFRTVIKGELLTWCREHGYDLENAGLKIYTTIDSRMQRYAEEAVAERMRPLQANFNAQWHGRSPWVDRNGNEIKEFLQSKIKQTEGYRNLVKKYGRDSDSVSYYLNQKKQMQVFSWNGERDTLFSSMDSLGYYQRFLQAGFMAMDASTGAVKAWVGGINHKYFKYDHVKQGKRQPGSTFKPFVYGLAMENGYSPCYELIDISPSFQLSNGRQWWPLNSNGKKGSGKTMNLREAMALSVNTITAQMMKNLGPENVVKFAQRLGIKSKLDAVPALCLGVSDVSLFELAGAYSVFVNNGFYTEPFYITRIEDKNGNLIESFTPKSAQVVNESVAYKMIYMLQGGVEIEGATSFTLDKRITENNEVGGKTGTTSDASDGWYMGATRDIVAGAWVGGDERVIHFETWSSGQGGKTARPIWETFMLKLYSDNSLPYKKGPFRRPQSNDDLESIKCTQHHDLKDTETLEKIKDGELSDEFSIKDTNGI